jgi:GNAT superfamily N-acetyltransferase
MTALSRPGLRRQIHKVARQALSQVPRPLRHRLFRWMVDCDPRPDPRLQLSIATSAEDLEACFALLHDAYVASGFMKPDPSGLRVTPYHALPTTTTLQARWDGEVVGTLSIIREGVFGFPLQSVFDLTQLRAQDGRIAEISALAIHPRFRKTGGTVLFPLMKFMYEYCTRYFDTRHLVIAVNPNRIELYESLLFFRRLTAHVVDNYDFANGAPAIGATLDLHEAPDLFRRAYGGRSERKDLSRYFTQTALPNIQWPQRPYYTTTDPVMSPALMDHFFNRRTSVFEQLDERKRALLHALYPERAFRAVLPSPPASIDPATLRQHRRHALKCPARFVTGTLSPRSTPMEVVDVSLHGCMARSVTPWPEQQRGRLQVQLGQGRYAEVDATIVRSHPSPLGTFYGLRIDEPDQAWRRCIRDLEVTPGTAPTAGELPPGGGAIEVRPAVLAAA